MELIIEPEAEEDLKQLEKEYQKYIKERLQELKSKPTGHEDSDTIRIQGRQIFKYIMKEGSRGRKDFRAVYDIIDDQIRIVAIFHRDKGYNKEEINNRL